MPRKRQLETVYRYEPRSVKPRGVEKPKKIERITEREVKKAFDKIWKKTEKLRELKDTQLEIQRNLDAVKKELEQEIADVGRELEKYMREFNTAFDAVGYVLDRVYALEDKEGVILAAVRQMSVYESDEAGVEPKKKSPSVILQTLKDMGKVTDEMIAEAEQQIDDFNKALEKIGRYLYTFPPAKKDVIASRVRLAGIVDFLKGLWNRVKKFASNMFEYAAEFDALADELESFV